MDTSRAITQRDRPVFNPSQFNYMADSNGYMITYRGRSIGGAGVKLPREKPLRGKQAQKNLEEFAGDAKREIEQLKAGCGTHNEKAERPAEVAQIYRREIETKEGHTIAVFYNDDTRLLVVDVVHTSEQGGNEIIRRTLNFDALFDFIND